MNPVRRFELSAQQAWSAKIAPEERAIQLERVGLAIAKYLERARNVELSENPWERHSINRALIYLEQLGKDVQILAGQCRSKEIKASLKV
jgi:hypothetical protein